MEVSAREEILARLKAAPKKPVGVRPLLPQAQELSLTLEQMIERFTAQEKENTGVVHRVQGREGLLALLAEIAREEGVASVMASTDPVLAPLDLPLWGEQNGVRVFTAGDFPDRAGFTDCVFDGVDAGITGADFAIAESGTLGIIHGPDQPRLVSIAPPLHIAVVPVERVCQVYEQAIASAFAGPEPPRHFSFNTGPSSTGDIGGVHFKGMHGPRKVIIILVD
jgi:L-lactate dehydrogenase complex protein LldG